MIMSRSTLLKKMIWSKILVKIKTRILYLVTFFKMCLYEIMCKNMAFARKITDVNAIVGLAMT